MNTIAIKNVSAKSKVAKAAMLPAAGLSLVLSLSLFGLMYSVIKAGHGALEKKDALPTIDFVRLKRDSEVETLSRHKPPPPPPAPPPPPKMKMASEAVAHAALTGLEIPNLNLKADVSGEAMVGKKATGAAMFDGELIPLNCPSPQTPADARRAGLKGWVLVEVVVGPDGSPKSVKAVDAQPKGVFEAAVVMALQRCKFKPTVKDGVPVQQTARRKYNFTGPSAE